MYAAQPTPYAQPAPYPMAAMPVVPAALPAAPTPSVYGRDAFVPSAAYASAAPAASAPAYAPAAYAPVYMPDAYAPSPYALGGSFAPQVLRLEDIPGTPERMKVLTKQVMAPYFEGITWALRTDPEVVMAVSYGVYSDAQRLRLVERVKELVSGIYNLPPITTQVLDEPWVGGGYSFDDNQLYSITTGLLQDASAGDLIYLTVHEMTHAFQHRMVSFPIAPGGALGELTAAWRGNSPQTHGYLAYSGEDTFEAYAEQPLEFAAFLAGNFAEFQVTGANARRWGTDETEAWDLYA